MFIDNIYKDGIDEFLINTFFDKYQQGQLALKLQTLHTRKEFILIKLIQLVREKMSFPCAYLLFLRNLDITLWYLLFYSNR